MSDSAESIEHKIVAEGHTLADCFNASKESHSPKLEWFAMGTDHETGDQFFVFEATSYIDGDGLAALRECGRTIQSIEAHHFDDEISVQIEVLVQGDIPEWGEPDGE